ncbi:hypothetical protein B566_EDAN004597 [Ephemera danica]|nr:hypothetical protein B566_EDAN004597 [Ephemera danica]
MNDEDRVAGHLMNESCICGACRFPEAWSGRWFQSGVTQLLAINASLIETKGSCVENDGDKYILEDNGIGRVSGEQHSNSKRVFCYTMSCCCCMKLRPFKASRTILSAMQMQTREGHRTTTSRERNSLLALFITPREYCAFVRPVACIVRGGELIQLDLYCVHWCCDRRSWEEINIVRGMLSL